MDAEQLGIFLLTPEGRTAKLLGEIEGRVAGEARLRVALKAVKDTKESTRLLQEANLFRLETDQLRSQFYSIPVNPIAAI